MTERLAVARDGGRGGRDKELASDGPRGTYWEYRIALHFYCRGKYVTVLNWRNFNCTQNGNFSVCNLYLHLWCLKTE